MDCQRHGLLLAAQCVSKERRRFFRGQSCARWNFRRHRRTFLDRAHSCDFSGEPVGESWTTRLEILGNFFTRADFHLDAGYSCQFGPSKPAGRVPDWRPSLLPLALGAVCSLGHDVWTCGAARLTKNGVVPTSSGFQITAACAYVKLETRDNELGPAGVRISCGAAGDRARFAGTTRRWLLALLFNEWR